MSIEIKDYLNLYLGCEYKSAMKNIPDGIIAGFSIHPEIKDCCFVDISFIDPDDGKEITIPTNCFDEIKPILRPLSDMTDKQKEWYGGRTTFDSYEFLWLLKEGFDLFGLIDAGLAIDKTKLNTQKPNQ